MNLQAIDLEGLERFPGYQDNANLVQGRLMSEWAEGLLSPEEEKIPAIKKAVDILRKSIIFTLTLRWTGEGNGPPNDKEIQELQDDWIDRFAPVYRDLLSAGYSNAVLETIFTHYQERALCHFHTLKEIWSQKCDGRQSILDVLTAVHTDPDEWKVERDEQTGMLLGTLDTEFPDIQSNGDGFLRLSYHSDDTYVEKLVVPMEDIPVRNR